MNTGNHPNVSSKDHANGFAHLPHATRKDRPTAVERQIVNDILQNVDTIQIYWPIHLKPKQYFGKLDENTKQMKTGFVFRMMSGIMPSTNGGVITIKYIPHTYDQSSYFYLEFSVPKLVTGNNYERKITCDDICSMLETEIAIVADTFGLKDLNLFSGALGRIDLCKNFQVGENLAAYIRFAGSRSYPRKHRVLHDNNKQGKKKTDSINNGVEFEGKSTRKQKRILLYDKQLQCGDPSSKGILRLEVSFHGTRAVRSLLGNENLCEGSELEDSPDIGKSKKVTLLDLPPDLPEKVISKELDVLGLSGVITSKEDFRNELKKHFKGTMIGRLMDFAMCAYEHPELTTKQLAEYIGCGEATVYKYRKLLRDKELAYNGDRIVQLPPLHFNEPAGEDHQVQNVEKCANDIHDQGGCIENDRTVVFDASDTFLFLATSLFQVPAMVGERQSKAYKEAENILDYI